MTDSLFNRTQFLASLAGDKELAGELLEAFLMDCPQRTNELQKALEAGDAPTASKLAHSLKGMSGVVRAERLVELARDMEELARDNNLDKVRDIFAQFTLAQTQTTGKMHAYLNS